MSEHTWSPIFNGFGAGHCSCDSAKIISKDEHVAHVAALRETRPAPQGVAKMWTGEDVKNGEDRSYESDGPVEIQCPHGYVPGDCAKCQPETTPEAQPWKKVLRNGVILGEASVAAQPTPQPQISTSQVEALDIVLSTGDFPAIVEHVNFLVGQARNEALEEAAFRLDSGCKWDPEGLAGKVVRNEASAAIRALKSGAGR